MRRLMLLRHAKSDWPGGIDDPERPLAKRGRQASPGMGKYMADEGLRPDLAIVSTARRARETWELACPAFVGNIAQRDEPRIYEARANAILDVVRETKPAVHALLLVGHNPGLQDLALKLIGKASQSDLARLKRKYPTAGLVVIDFDVERWREVSEDFGRLERFETPKSVQRS
jgi:phosphohistidine phosphatase